MEMIKKIKSKKKIRRVTEPKCTMETGSLMISDQESAFMPCLKYKSSNQYNNLDFSSNRRSITARDHSPEPIIPRKQKKKTVDQK
jgi:hypothetical protein